MLTKFYSSVLINANNTCISKVGNLGREWPEGSFSIATTPRCRGGCYSFSGLLHLTLDPYLIMLSVKQGSIKYYFLSLWYDSAWFGLVYLFLTFVGYLMPEPFLEEQ